MKIDLGHDGTHNLTVELQTDGLWSFRRDGDHMRYIHETTLEYHLIQQFVKQVTDK